MKKIIIVLLTVALVFSLSVASFALISPTVSQKHGQISGMLVSGNNNGSFLIDGEYGLTKDLAVTGMIGNDITKLGVKYELNPSIAAMGGLYATSGSTNVYLGIDGASAINKQFMLIGELDATSIGGNFVFLYELGGKYNLEKQLDIRGGVFGGLGSGSSSQISLELGVAYKF